MQMVIIGGLPCSGKSKLAERLSARVQLPFIGKDSIKEALFDCLGASDRSWSRRVSTAAYQIMFKQAEELLRCGVGCIVEGNFRAREHHEQFERLGALAANFVQVHCRADSSVLVARFRERALDGVRHAGHADIESLPEIEEELRTAVQAPLAIGGELVDCDTTHDWSAAIDRAVEQAANILHR